jgi:hypothetical protein
MLEDMNRRYPIEGLILEFQPTLAVTNDNSEIGALLPDLGREWFPNSNTTYSCWSERSSREMWDPLAGPISRVRRPVAALRSA